MGIGLFSLFVITDLAAYLVSGSRLLPGPLEAVARAADAVGGAGGRLAAALPPEGRHLALRLLALVLEVQACVQKSSTEMTK